MESKINYTLVGLFVVLLMAGLFIFVYWLAKHGGQQKYVYYHVYMAESVAGLSTDASVKYRGVEVGQVEHIGLNPENSEQVELLLIIEQKTPVKVDSTATLKSFGLTGLTYVELEGGSLDSPLLSAKGDEIPVITASPSLFTQAYESIGGLTEISLLAVDKFNRLLSDENLNNITSILAETKLLVKDIRSQLQGVKQLVNNGVIMEKRMITAFKKVEEASASIKKMSDSLEVNSSDFGHHMSQDIRQSLESFNQLMYQLNNLAEELQRTTQAIEASPSDLIFKSSQPRPGPGEEGYNEK